MNTPLGTSSFNTAPKPVQATRTGERVTPPADQQEQPSYRRIGGRGGRAPAFGAENQLANIVRDTWSSHIDKNELHYANFQMKMTIVRTGRNRVQLAFPVAVFFAISKSNNVHIAHHAVVLSSSFKEHSEETQDSGRDRDRDSKLSRPVFGYEVFREHGDAIIETALYQLNIAGSSLSGTYSHTSHNLDISDTNQISRLIYNASDAAVDSIMGVIYGAPHKAGAPDPCSFKAVVTWSPPGSTGIDENGFVYRNDFVIKFINTTNEVYGKEEAQVSGFVDFRLTPPNLNQDKPAAMYDPALIITNVKTGERDRVDAETLFWIVTAYDALVLRTRGYLYRCMTLGDPERDPGHLDRLVNLVKFYNDPRGYDAYRDGVEGRYGDLRDPSFTPNLVKAYFDDILHQDNIALLVDVNLHGASQWMFSTILDSYLGDKKVKGAADDEIFESLNVFTSGDFPLDYNGDIFSGSEANYIYSSAYRKGNALKDIRGADSLFMMNVLASTSNLELERQLDQYASASEDPEPSKSNTPYTVAVPLYNVQASILGESQISTRNQTFSTALQPDGLIVRLTMDPEFIEKTLSSFSKVYGMERSVPDQTAEGDRRRAERARGFNAGAYGGRNNRSGRGGYGRGAGYR